MHNCISIYKCHSHIVSAIHIIMVNASHATMVVLKKKPNTMTCENHRTFSLLKEASKFVLRYLTK